MQVRRCVLNSGAILSNQTPSLTASGCEGFVCYQKVRGQGTLILLQERVGSSCDCIWRHFCEPCRVQLPAARRGKALTVRWETLLYPSTECALPVPRGGTDVPPCCGSASPRCSTRGCHLQLFEPVNKKHFLYQNLGKSLKATHFP